MAIRCCSSAVTAIGFGSIASPGAGTIRLQNCPVKPEGFQIYCSRPFGGEVCVEEVLVSEFVVGIVVNVLSHIRVEHCESGGVSWISASTRDFTVWDPPEFVVLYPKIGLQDF